MTSRTGICPSCREPNDIEPLRDNPDSRNPQDWVMRNHKIQNYAHGGHPNCNGVGNHPASMVPDSPL